MRRNLKALGLALAAVFAMSAVSASAASATTHDFHSHGNTVTAEAENTQVFTTESSELTLVCEELTATGMVAEGESEEVEVHPVYNNEENACENSLIGSMTVETEGCDYVFTGETDANGHAEVHVVCEAGHEINIVSSGCTLHIPEQTVTGIHYNNQNENTNEKDITVEATVTGIHYTSSGFLCGFAGIPSEGNDGVEEGNSTVKGYSDTTETTQTGVWFTTT